MLLTKWDEPEDDGVTIDWEEPLIITDFDPAPEPYVPFVDTTVPPVSELADDDFPPPSGDWVANIMILGEEVGTEDFLATEIAECCWSELGRSGDSDLCFTFFSSGVFVTFPVLAEPPSSSFLHQNTSLLS